MKEDPPPDAKCRDKFLVQSVGISPNTDTSANVSQIWSNIEQTAKSSIQERKIRVTFLPANGSLPPSTGASHDESPPAYSSPSPAAVTPARSTVDTKDTNEGSTLMGSTIMGSAAGSATGAASGAASSFSSAAPSNQDELKQQLSAAQAQITQLKDQAAEGLRQRKPQEAMENALKSMPQSVQNASAQAPGGVSVQVAAGLCLLCFLIAYFLF